MDQCPDLALMCRVEQATLVGFEKTNYTYYSLKNFKLFKRLLGIAESLKLSIKSYEVCSNPQNCDIGPFEWCFTISMAGEHDFQAKWEKSISNQTGGRKIYARIIVNRRLFNFFTLNRQSGIARPVLVCCILWKLGESPKIWLYTAALPRVVATRIPLKRDV